MTLQTYSIINIFLVLVSFIGLILPAFIIYFNSAYKNYFALIISIFILGLILFVLQGNSIILLPVILPILIAGFLGTYLRRIGEDYWFSMGYMIAAEIFGIIIGIVIIYFSYGKQDIAGLISQGFYNAYSSSSANNILSNSQLTIMTWILSYASNGTLDAFETIDAMSIAEKLEILVPQIKLTLARLLPSLAMVYGILSGVFAWALSSIMLSSRARKNKEIKGVKQFAPPPKFSSWQLPRWFTNLLILLLLSSLFVQFIEVDSIENVAVAIQSVVMTIFSIQGLAVMYWFLKRKRMPTTASIVICTIVFILFNLLLLWLGILDMIFSFRTMDKRKELIKKKMEELRTQIDEQEKKEKKNENDNNNDDDDEGEEK